MGHVANPYKLEEFLFHRRCSCDVTTILKAGLIAGGRNSKQGRPTIFFKLVNPFGTVQTKNLAMTCQNRKKYTTIVSGKYSGRRLLDQLNQSTRKRITILADKVSCHNVYSSVPADCIYKVSSHKGERTQFERLSTPRPAPKIVLKSAWQSHQQQQQQQDTFESASSSTRKLVQRVERVEREEPGNPTNKPELPSARKLERSTESLVEKKARI